MRYVIKCEHGTYVEGQVFTDKQSEATRFDSRDKARKACKRARRDLCGSMRVFRLVRKVKP